MIVQAAGREPEPRHELGRRARLGHLAVAQKHDLVGQRDDALLVRDDDDGAPVAGLVDVAERLGEAVEAPQVDAGLGLVVDGQLRVAG